MIKTAQPEVGELLFIARLDKSKLNTSAFPQSYTDLGTAGAVEGSVLAASGSCTVFIGVMGMSCCSGVELEAVSEFVILSIEFD